MLTAGNASLQSMAELDEISSFAVCTVCNTTRSLELVRKSFPTML